MKNNNTYEKIFLASLGLVSVSVKEIKKVLEEISSKQPTGKELEKFIAKLSKEGKSRQQEIEKQIKSSVRMVLKELDIPTKSELKKLEKKIKSSRAKK
ncbi:MAG: hypothetical protein HY005_01605 [Candidatus Staskawiczbacteria bacterium]|nr:hypothetical protein [Candidatus Staskawiczbacteria bacterium]